VHTRFITFCLVAAVLLGAAPPAARADSYPSKPIRFIVPFSAGGQLDYVARLVAQPMSENLKQSIIVENDGRHISLGILEEKFWRNLVDALGDDFPLLRNPGYANRAGRLAVKRDLNRQLREIFASRTRAQWEERLTGLDIPWAPALEYDELFENDHVRHRGVVQPEAQEHRESFPVRFSKPLPVAPGRVAELDEDRADILDWLQRKEDGAG
jgi:crotonobetainyl-CoA:carnitine CoA-transferase CaiB-like acyl-CoA transferase